MRIRYIINENGQPEPAPDLLLWARWFETADRVVAKTEVGEDIMVSTVFLGTDHQWGDGPPILYETLVFGGELDGEMERYSTQEDAKVGHAAMVERVQNGDIT